MKIYKYPLRIDGRQSISMPVGSKILCVQLQYGQPTLWVLVPDCDDAVEARQFAVYGTGEMIVGNSGDYLGTVQIATPGSNGGYVFVWHVFEVT